jgi:hypothetical protein
MNMKILAMMCCVLLVSCSRGDIEQIHHDAVVDGYNKLPIAKSLHDRFGGWSFIVHFNIATPGYKDTEKEWGTETYINGRYHVTYVQQVVIDKKTMRIVKEAGGAKLYIKEVERVFKDNGSPAMDYGDFQKVIEGEDLQKLFKSGWDFSSIGFDLNKTPIENIQLWKDYWKQLYPKQ